MNMQEVFDHIVKGLAEQGEASTTNEFCKYRLEVEESGKVLRCAAGMCIDEEHYDIALEGSGIMASEVQQAIYNSGFWPTDADERQAAKFLRYMQSIHDNLHIKDWSFGYKRVATTFGLSEATVPDSFVK